MGRIDLCPVYQMRLAKATAWQIYKCTGIKRVCSLGSFAMGGSIQGTPFALCEYSRTTRLNSFTILPKRSRSVDAVNSRSGKFATRPETLPLESRST